MSVTLVCLSFGVKIIVRQIYPAISAFESDVRERLRVSVALYIFISQFVIKFASMKLSWVVFENCLTHPRYSNIDYLIQHSKICQEKPFSYLNKSHGTTFNRKWHSHNQKYPYLISCNTILHTTLWFSFENGETSVRKFPFVV